MTTTEKTGKNGIVSFQRLHYTTVIPPIVYLFEWCTQRSYYTDIQTYCIVSRFVPMVCLILLQISCFRVRIPLHRMEHNDERNEW